MNRLISDQQRSQLVANGLAAELTDGASSAAYRPVVRLHIPGTRAQWLISELIPGCGDRLIFGLADLGVGFPEMGESDMYDLLAVGVVVADPRFKPTKSLGEYADAARVARRIVL